MKDLILRTHLIQFVNTDGDGPTSLYQCDEILYHGNKDDQ